MPTPVALRRMLSRVPTPSACGVCICGGLGLGTHRFGFGHCAGWMIIFCKGNRPFKKLPKKTRKSARVHTPQRNGTHQHINTSRSTKRGRGSPYPQIRSGYITPAVSGCPKEGGLATSPLPSRGSPTRGQNQKWLHNPCRLGAAQPKWLPYPCHWKL